MKKLTLEEQNGLREKRQVLSSDPVIQKLNPVVYEIEFTFQESAPGSPDKR